MVNTELKKKKVILSCHLQALFFLSLLHLFTHSFTFQCSNVISYTEETYISPNPAMWALPSNQIDCECLNTVGYFIINVGEATFKELHIFISGASSLFWFYHHNFLRVGSHVFSLLPQTDYFFPSNSSSAPPRILEKTVYQALITNPGARVAQCCLWWLSP